MNNALRNATVGALLFGGTLGTANAGVTVNSATVALNVGGFRFTTGNVATAMAGGLAHDAITGGSLTLSPFTSTGFTLSANSAGGAAFWSVVFNYTFTATSDMTAVLSGTTAAEGAVIVMLDTTSSTTMFRRFDGDATAWTSGNLALVSGHSYSLAINPSIAERSTDTGTVLTLGLALGSAPVPAPGAMVLLGAAGLVSSRRRRN